MFWKQNKYICPQILLRYSKDLFSKDVNKRKIIKISSDGKP